MLVWFPSRRRRHRLADALTCSTPLCFCALPFFRRLPTFCPCFFSFLFKLVHAMHMVRPHGGSMGPCGTLPICIPAVAQTRKLPDDFLPQECIRPAKVRNEQDICCTHNQCDYCPPPPCPLPPTRNFMAALFSLFLTMAWLLMRNASSAALVPGFGRMRAPALDI